MTRRNILKGGGERDWERARKGERTAASEGASPLANVAAKLRGGPLADVRGVTEVFACSLVLSTCGPASRASGWNEKSVGERFFRESLLQDRSCQRFCFFLKKKKRKGEREAGRVKVCVWGEICTCKLAIKASAKAAPWAKRTVTLGETPQLPPSEKDG